MSDTQFRKILVSQRLEDINNKIIMHVYYEEPQVKIGKYGKGNMMTMQSSCDL